jgi:two-component system, NarL family, invasion response regulator UvrY
MTKLKVFIVDDMPSMRLLIKHYLSRNNAVTVVGEAIEGVEAFKKIKEFLPDVVILDMSLPGASGVEIARKIKSFSQNIYVYLCSAYELNEYRELKIDSPADGFIQKSSLKPELEAVIRKEIERKNTGHS